MDGGDGSRRACWLNRPPRGLLVSSSVEEGRVDHDESSDKRYRARLAGLERDLAREDPALARRMAVFNARAAGGVPTWAAFGASLMLLLIGAQTFVMSLRWDSPVLFIVSIVVFCCVMAPLTRSARRRHRSGPAHPTDRGVS